MIDKPMLTYKDLQERWDSSNPTVRKILKDLGVMEVRLSPRKILFRIEDIREAESRLAGDV